MSEIEISRLRKELEQAKAREEKERREKEQAKAQKEQERLKNQQTTLEEYLYNCHFHLYRKLRLAPASESSTGITRVDGKYYPKWLRPWRQFENTHRQRHFEAIKTACGERRLFNQESTTRNNGSSIARRKAADERAIEHFEKIAVEDPVWEILCPIWEDKDFRAEYQCSDVRFSSRRDVLGAGDPATSPDSMQEGQERRRRTGPMKRMASEQRVRPPLMIPDGWGLRIHADGQESYAFVFDYKAAHKVSAGAVKSAVANDKLFMEVTRRICSSKYNSDDDAREHEKTEEAIAMALVQVFDYMIRYEVAYGYVAAGTSLLLLHVDRGDPQTLYCHACVPQEDVGEPVDGGFAENKVTSTAVAQVASFYLLSLMSGALRGASLDKASQTAEATLRRWREPYEDAERLLEAENTASLSPAPPSPETGSIYTSSASPANGEVTLRSKSSCRTANVLTKDQDEEDEGPDAGRSEFRQVHTSKRKDGPSSSSSEGEDLELSSSAPTRQYCTQACLLGLKRRTRVDDDCPNVSLHRTAGDSQHAVDAETFTRLVSEQLRKNPYHKCDALDNWGKWGAVGVLFKLELEPYGYTFVGKGALSGYPHDLKRESDIYARLNRLQGMVVPVHLGIVELDRGHIVTGSIRVFDMMLMSWSGEKASKSGAPDLATEVHRSLKAVWDEGVYHGDERGDNQLWNEERRRVMVIDFDRAVLRPKPANKALLRMSGNKRKRQREEFGSKGKRRSLENRAPPVASQHPVIDPETSDCIMLGGQDVGGEETSERTQTS